MKKGAYLFSCLLLLCLLIIPQHVSAATIFEHQSTVIPSDQTVDDVYVVGGDADIQGHVTGIVIIINGDLHARSTAKIDGMVVVIGGKVDQAQGAAFGDDVYNLSLDGPTQNSLLVGGGLVIGLWIVQLGGTLLLVLLPTLISWIGKKKSQMVIERFSSTSWSRLLYMGFLIGMVLTALSALLLITILGIPILILILIVLSVTFVVGLTVIAHRIGEQIRLVTYKPDWFKVMMGSLVIVAACNVPFLGWIVLLLLILISLGICVEWLASSRKRILTK